MSVEGVDDLMIHGRHGDRDSISYHQYLSAELRKQGSLLVIHFATRFILIHGERLFPYITLLQHRRRHLAELRISSRDDLIKAKHDKRPIITAIEVATPKVGEIRLDAALAEQDPQQTLQI